MRYYNKTTGEWYYGTSIMRRINENTVFSGYPTVEQLEEWGFEEYEEPEEDVLETIRQEKLSALAAYNQSEAVNGFLIGGRQMWLNFEERSRLQKAVDAKEAMGKSTMSKNWGGREYVFPIAVWKRMLAELEDFAYDCQDRTDRHRAAIQSLGNERDIEDYDFTVGYPDKPVFEMA